jgi:TP901 family phage tail tape measure protein
MATKFVIPSIFTAVDQFSPVVIGMRRNMGDFGAKAETSIARTERAFRKLTPALGGVQKQMLSMVGTGAALAAGFQLGRFSFDAIKDYETAVDSFRVIVSDLNDAEFGKYQSEIDKVAKTTKRSATDVAQSFEKIAGLNETFASSADGIGMVSTAAITLAKAARMDLGTAAENLVGIMNQFSYGTDKANKTINVLAAGQAVGAANITQTAEAFTVFGSIAAGANITLEQSVGLIQTLGKYSLFGAEAGTKLRGSILRLQRAGIGYASGQFSVNDALEQTNQIVGKLSTSKQKDALLTKLFGAENITAGRILLTNVETYKKFTASVSNTTEAQKAAEINTKNLATAGSELSAAWINMITGSEAARSGVGELTNGINWLAKNLVEVVNTGINAVKMFVIFKTAMMAAKFATIAWNVSLGISTALMGASGFALRGNTTAMAAWKTMLALSKIQLVQTAAATEGATAATAGFNTVLAANPVGLIVLGLTALAAATAYLVYNQRKLNAEYMAQFNMEIDAHIIAQSKATQQLAEHWAKVGYNTKDATLKALEYQTTTTAANLSSAKTNEASKTAAVVSAYDNAWFPAFSSDVARAQRELDDAKRAVSMATADKLGATNSVIASMNAGIISQSEGAALVGGRKVKTGDPMQMQPENRPRVQFGIAETALIEQMNAQIGAAGNATITIKNDSSNPVQMNNGQTKIIDVQPSMQSTKVLLTPAYGR